MRAWLSPLFTLFVISCAIGPTPERSGFNYPQAGLRFSPRVHVTSDTVRGTVATTGDTRYVLLFPRTTSHIESPNVRLLTTGIAGEWDEDAQPLFDEIGVVLYGAEPQNTFELVEKRDIELPWPGLVNKRGELRIFRMSEIGGEVAQYTFTVLVHHYGNTIEFCWRDSSGNPPDEHKMQVFFYWTRGLRFTEPEAESG
jgi:hypothetical protein